MRTAENPYRFTAGKSDLLRLAGQRGIDCGGLRYLVVA
jgi:hypothetical protein